MSSQWAFSKHAVKDSGKLAILEILAVSTFQNPRAYEKLVGDLAGTYSRRINIQHRLVYHLTGSQVVLRMWTHDEQAVDHQGLPSSATERGVGLDGDEVRVRGVTVAVHQCLGLQCLVSHTHP